MEEERKKLKKPKKVKHEDESSFKEEELSIENIKVEHTTEVNDTDQEQPELKQEKKKKKKKRKLEESAIDDVVEVPASSEMKDAGDSSEKKSSKKSKKNKSNSDASLDTGGDIVEGNYIVHPDMRQMSVDDVNSFRAEHNMNIYPEEESLKYKPVTSLSHIYPSLNNNNCDEIISYIQKKSFTKPTAIQSQCWPLLLSGRDCIGIASTGSGKIQGIQYTWIHGYMDMCKV